MPVDRPSDGHAAGKATGGLAVTTRSDPALDTILEDFLTRREDNQTPAPEEYLARHPEFAEELGQFFSDLEFVDTKLADQRGTFPALSLPDIGLPDIGLDRPDGNATNGGRVVRDWNLAPATDGSAGSTTQLPAIGRFKVLEELGSGSQGVVYKAEQLGTKRIVALKIIREGAFASAVERRRFENEVQLSSQLKHPNIVAIFECGRDQGRDFFAMEYVEGVPLDVYLSSRTLSVDETIQLLLQVCDGVNYAHQHGIIHRDLKPTNVIVDSHGKAHILDFGLAKRIVDEESVPAARVTQVGMFAGTWHYASPEQVRRDAGLLDVRSDVYALGVIFYEALTDAYPYPIDGESRAKIAEHILETVPLRPSAIRADIDDDVDTIVLRALQKDPARRYQSAAAFGEDLRRYLAGEAIEAKRDSHWYILRMTLRRYRWQATAALVGVAVLVSFAVTVTILYADATAARATTEVRSELVRSSQQYLVEKLDDLHRLSNAVREIRETDRLHPAVQRLQKPLQTAPAQLLLEASKNIPNTIDKMMHLADTPDFADGKAWLNAKRRRLEEIESATLSFRFEFPTMDDAADADWIIFGLPMHVGEAEQVSKALVALALLDFHDGNDDSAIRNLSAARSLALDLGDGRTLIPIDSSIATRMRTYEALLYILEASATQGTRGEAYIAFAMSDPPLASYKEVLITERLKLSQLVEGATRAGRLGGSRYLDLDALETRFPGLYESLGPGPDGRPRHVLDVSVEELSEAIERFAHEAQSWENLPLREVAGRQTALHATLASHDSTRVLTPLLPNLRPCLVMRARVDAMRSATLLAAYVCRYHLDRGEWPERLSDAVPQDTSMTTIDPYTGVEFGYRIVNGNPVLNSISDDGHDSHGRPAAWGQPTTEVVFFSVNRPNG
jgi:tRNA A-37 threonylcarbamoyl transferase component Bud32